MMPERSARAVPAKRLVAGFDGSGFLNDAVGGRAGGGE